MSIIMLIIKDKNDYDYYDNVAKANLDTAIVYRRVKSAHSVDYKWNNPGKVRINGNTFEFNFPKYYDIFAPGIINKYMIGFCGQTYNLIVERSHKSVPKINYFYNPSLSTYREVIGNRKSYYIDNEADLSELSFPKELFRFLKAPVFMITHGKLYVNPNLKELSFFKVKDAYSAYKEISSFISGYLGSEERQILTISDKDKIVQYGYDPYLSFRHPVK